MDKNNNTNTSNEELLSSLIKLETALSKVADKLDEFNSNNTSSTSTSSFSSGYKLKKFKSYGNIFENKPGQKRNFKNYEKDKSEEEKKRTEAERNFWLLNREKIHELALYQIELDNKRRQHEIDFWGSKEDEIKKLDDLENSLIERREAKQLRGRKRAAEFEKKTTDKEGRTKSNKEVQEIINKWKEFKKENTFVRASGIAIGAATSKISKGVDFLSSDKQLSISDVGGKIANVAGMMGPWGKAAGALIQGLTAAVEMADKINKSASDYSRTVGGGLAKMKEMRTQATGTANAISKWGDKAYKFDKILEHTTELSKETGRVMDHMSNMDFKSLEDLRQWGIDSSVLNQFDTFGLSMETIDKRIKSIYSTSGKQGLNAKAVTDVITKNLKMAQNYTFAGGLRSLERMAQKSVALKYNMESVSRFADKVSTLEGAATAGAQLSVLGGDFARMGNPLTMLYGGLQDVEQLNDMMLNMTKNMAQWDSDKGQMEITAYNRQRLKAAADAMGVDYSELVNQAMTQGKRNRIDNQLDAAGRVNDDTTREYIKNIAQVDEEGKGYVVFHEGGEERRVDVDKLTENDKEKLKEESKRFSDEQNAKLGDVLSQTRTITEQLNDLIDTLRAKIANGIISIYNLLDKSKWIGSGGKNQIDISSNGLTGAQKDIYNSAIKARDKGWEKLSGDEQASLKNIGITSRAQVAGKSNEELSSMASSPVQTETEKKAHGGIIHGKGTSMSDSIPAMLSNGEFVMNAKATNKHLPTLQAWNADGFNSGTILPIKAGNNQTNPLSVKENISNIGNSQQDNKKLTIEPITVNISGTINLTGGGASKSLDIKNIINDNTFISYLTRQIEKSINFSFNANESKSHMPYTIPFA